MNSRGVMSEMEMGSTPLDTESATGIEEGAEKLGIAEPEPEVRSIHIRLFRRGDTVQYEGQNHVVDYVTVSSTGLRIAFLGGITGIDENQVESKWTEIMLNRKL